MITRARIIQLVGFTALLMGVPLTAVKYQPALRDPDIWWHMRVGEWISSGHGFPHTAVFSRFAETQSWLAYSWVFEVLVSRLYRWFGLPALPTFVFVFQIAIGAALLWAVLNVTRSWWKAALLTGAALSASFFTLSPRPVLFTVLFFVVEMTMIFRDLRERRIRSLYWSPLLFIVWANCHIQFVNGLLVLGLLCACELFQHLVSAYAPQSRPDLQWSKLLMIFFVCLIATLMNPYGWHLYEPIFSYAKNSAQWNEIAELLAPDFRRPAHYLELLLVCATALALGWRRTHSIFRIALLAVVTVLSFHAARESWMLSVAAAFLCAEAVAEPEDSAQTAPGWMIPVAGFAALGLCMLLQAKQVGYSDAALIREIDRMYPVRAASYLSQSNLPGPLYNSLNWGGYLIYNAREYPVAVDGRNDAYGELGEIAMKVAQGYPGWKQDPTFAASNLVLIERNLPLAGLLAQDPDFKLVYRDHLSAIFLRTRR